MMRKLFTLFGALAVLGVASCGTNPSNEVIGTGVGAAAGGALGNAATGGSAIGTIGGAAAGAVVGHEIGEEKDRHDRD